MYRTRPRAAEQAIGRWPGILHALGIDSKYLRNQHGPCPMCDGTDRYRFDDKDGRGTWICSQCGAGDGFSLLMKLHDWRFAYAAREVEKIIGTVQLRLVAQERSEEAKLRALRNIWSSSETVVKGDPVWRYLNRRIGIELVPKGIRHYPQMRHSEGGTYPAMVALMRYPNGEIASIHRTYLTGDGQKAPVSATKKFMQGKPLQTSSVWLGPIVPRMGVAEGIETALAASKLFGMPFFAAGNASLLEAWIAPAGVTKVLIAGDNDANYTGQAAALALAKRLKGKGLEVDVRIPEVIGADWADGERQTM